MSSIAFTMRPSPVLLLESGPDDEAVEFAVEGVAAFLGLGPNIVCVLENDPKNNSLIMQTLSDAK
jgi:hypothetical protein